MKHVWQVAVMLTLAAGCAHAASAAHDGYYDYAKVLSVTPVTRTVYRKESEQVCRNSVRRSRATGSAVVFGDVRARAPGLSLSDILRDDLAAGRPTSIRECRSVAAKRPHTETVGYQVRYSYGSRIFTRTMTEHPGQRLRVRVELSRR